MPDFNFTRLDSRSVLSITGEDVHGFLNNLITVNMDKVSQTNAGYGGLLTPQGKILFDFFITPTKDGYLLDCASSQALELLKRLTFYKLRAKIEIADKSDALSVWALWGEIVPQDKGFADPRTPSAGRRLIAGKEQPLNDGLDVDETAYHNLRIQLGLADSDGDIGSGNLFPHEANFDQFGGVDFQKGCYVGQEVVSRMEHRATARKRILPVTSTSGTKLTSDSAVTGANKSVGTVLTVSDRSGLALLRLDRAQDCYDADGLLLADGQVLELGKPGWAHFDLPTARTK